MGPATTLGLDRLIATRHDVRAARAGEPGGDGAWHGPFRGRRHGQGMEHDDLRPYADGDDVRHVDWRTSARRNELHTRLYREEKEHVVTVALDLRDAMFTGSTTLRGVVAGLVAARLVWRAANGGCRTSLAVLADADARAGTRDGVRVELSRAASGERGALAACRLIAATFDAGRRRTRGEGARVASRDDAAANTLEPLFERLLGGGRRLGASIVVSGMDTPGAGFDTALARLATARPLAVVLVEDTLDRRAPPAARYRYAGAGGPRRITLGRRERYRLDAALAARRDGLERRFADARVPLIEARAGDAHVIGALRDAALLP